MIERDARWPARWRGRWIWDHEPDEAFWWRPTPADGHFTYLRRTFELGDVPQRLPARVSCDSRYVLYLNGTLLGRGPVRGEPEHLGWDEYDLATHLRRGSNVLVALCCYYGAPGPWWLPAAPLGTLGRGSFCFETAPDAGYELLTDERWRAAPSGRRPVGRGGMHAFPPESVDGRAEPAGLHDPEVAGDQWPAAVPVSGRGHGTVLDRPPAAPYMTPLRRPIPQMTRELRSPSILESDIAVRVDLLESPVDTWRALTRGEGDRRLSVWDVGGISIGHVHLRVTPGSAAHGGATVDVVGGEDLRADGLPEIAPRDWAARYLLGEDEATVTFFDPIGLRYLAVHHPPGVDVQLDFEEARYPRQDGARFTSDDARYAELWSVGLRTVDVCSTDAFLDCPGREQRAWVSDAYPQILVSLVTNPDQRLVRHHLALTSRSRLASGLLAGAAACDFARIGFTMPEYSLHWIRSLAAYWRYSGDEEFVRGLLPVANAIIDRYEAQRGPSGLLEEFPGWVFLDWAQVDRDTVTASHDALYAAALGDYAALPGATDVSHLIAATNRGFEVLWDAERGVYVDAMDAAGRRSRRISQHTNGLALLAGLVPDARVDGLIEHIMDPAGSDLRGRLVVTPTAADVRADGRIPVFQYETPTDFDEERDVVAAQPWFCRYLHEGLARHDRRDLILTSLLRWTGVARSGTFGEFWEAEPGRASRCHGWSSSPTYDLVTYALGVRPDSPGWQKTVVEPYPGPMRRLAGRVPTPHGWLSVTIDDDRVEVDAPPSLDVEVRDAALTAPAARNEVGA